MPTTRRPRAADQIREQIRAARGEQAGLKRIKSAIPLVARRRRLTQELDELGDVIRLRDDFGAEFRKAQDQLRLAEHTITKSRAALEEIDAQLAQLDPPRMLLDAATEIESLQERLGAVEKASHGPRSPGELSAGLPSTRRGGSSASWVARSIWMRPRRCGSGSMSRRSSAGWDSGSPSCAARPRRRGRRLPVMRTRSSARKKSGPTWNNRGMWNRSAGRSARLARPATSMRGLPRPAANSPARRKKRRPPWPSSPAGAARPKTFNAWPSP